MSYLFGDGFDCYATMNDAISGYWDSGQPTLFTLLAGRFAGSQAINLPTGNASPILLKISNVNDAVHHVVVAFRQTTALTGTATGGYVQFLDGVAPQCSIVFRTDGAILLTSGTYSGTVLATYTGAVTAANTWFAFEFEVVINNTTGSFTARKNGNTSNDFTLGSLNTRGGTANNYANRLGIGSGSGTPTINFDDILWRSDAASVPWIGDVRCYTRLPASDASAQFARSPSPSIASQTTGQSSTAVKASGAGLMSAFVAAFSGTISSASITLALGGTGNMKAAIYDATRAVVLATSNAVVNPVTGVNAITFSTPLTVTKGTTYHLAFDQDVSLTYNVTGSNQYTFTTAYASFPAAAPVIFPTTQGPAYTVNITPTISAEYVNEAQQDGTTSYVYDSTVGHADFYNLAALAATPASVIAVTTRGFLQKSDAGTRLAAVQIKSGATTVQSTPAALNTNFGWLYRTDTVDPATGLAWTPTGVSNAVIGPVVTG